jgi:4-hydroxybenzoate polyprenyltransferase
MSRFRAYAELVRLPNVFTAFADVVLGALAGRRLDPPTVEPTWARSFAALLAASGCLYAAGMAWNDYFDVKQDARERPFRPIPSGRVARKTAALWGAALLAGGLAFAALAGWRGGRWGHTPLVLAAALAAAILAYDGWLKRTAAGPVAMGSCRFLNVLLGLTAAGGFWPIAEAQGGEGVRLHLASVVGVYIVGVTAFARTEAGTSLKLALVQAAGIMAAALALALPLPLWFAPGTTSPAFPYLLVGTGFFVGEPVSRAIAKPTPATVQAAVKRAILGLVLLDATLATVFAGVGGVVILLLLLPALYLGRWIYST